MFLHFKTLYLLFLFYFFFEGGVGKAVIVANILVSCQFLPKDLLIVSVSIHVLDLKSRQRLGLPSRSSNFLSMEEHCLPPVIDGKNS